VEEVIDAAVYYYKTHHLPNWVAWRTWNPATKKWDIERATNGNCPPRNSFEVEPSIPPSSAPGATPTPR
jgi:hypothetical protein